LPEKAHQCLGDGNAVGSVFLAVCGLCVPVVGLPPLALHYPAQIALWGEIGGRMGQVCSSVPKWGQSPIVA